MKHLAVKKLLLAMGLVGLAGQAMAGLNLNGIAPGAADPVDIEINVSGASASDKQFKALFNDLCVGGTLSTYTDTCASGSGASCDPKLPGKSYTAYFCTMDNTTVTGLSGAQNVLFRKRSAGGSFWGTTPVAEATDVDQMVLTPANCAATLDPTVFKCDKNVLETTVSDAGVSDEEPALFVPPNVATGQSAITPAALSKLDVAPTSALTFGVPVTNGLYAALQQAQGLNPDLDGDTVFEGTSETASEADIIANMPSLSKEQVAALIKGNISSWAKVHYPVGGVSTPLTAIATNAPALNNVSICRRVNGSGTQAQMNANFLHVPCTSASSAAAVDNTLCTLDKGQENEAFGATACEGGDGYDGHAELTGVDLNKAIVHENSGSGDVSTCLDTLSDENFWALGVQSLEKASSKWSFIKLNGVEPTLAKVASGEYFDWAATTMQWRNQTVNGVLAPAGDQLAILNQVRSNAGNPTIADGINDGVNQGFGATGILALSTTAGVTVHPFNADAPVMQYTRGGKTCAVQSATSGNVDFSL